MIARWHQCGTMTLPMLARASFSAVCLTIFPLEFRPRTFAIGFYGKNSIISELMILECSFPLTIAYFWLLGGAEYNYNNNNNNNNNNNSNNNNNNNSYNNNRASTCLRRRTVAALTALIVLSTILVTVPFITSFTVPFFKLLFDLFFVFSKY